MVDRLLKSKLRYILLAVVCLSGVMTLLLLNKTLGPDRSAHIPVGSSTFDIWPTPVIYFSNYKFTAPYVLKDERKVGRYVVRLYHDPASNLEFEGMVVIAATGEPLLRIDTAVGIDALSGTDLTGDGQPDIVIQLHSGEKDCCYRTMVFTTAPALEKLLDVSNQQKPGEFLDTDKDGLKEFITCGDRFSDLTCHSADLSHKNVIFKYKVGKGYQVIN